VIIKPVVIKIPLNITTSFRLLVNAIGGGPIPRKDEELLGTRPPPMAAEEGIKAELSSLPAQTKLIPGG